MNIGQNSLNRHAPDYKKVAEEVDKILEENSIIKPPILPKEIAENYGIKVLFYDFPMQFSQVSGFCEFKTNKIFINYGDSPNRQTFTIAHELGHMRLHKEIFEQNPNEYKVLLRSPMGAVKDPLEQEANTFAATLLVPKRFLDQYYKIASISELSRLFIVSEDVIRYRLKHEYSI